MLLLLVNCLRHNIMIGKSPLLTYNCNLVFKKTSSLILHDRQTRQKLILSKTENPRYFLYQEEEL